MQDLELCLLGRLQSALQTSIFFGTNGCDSIKASHLINLKLLVCYIVRIVAITATAPRLMPTITHRIQLGIYGSFKACQILFIVSWAGAILFCHFIYRLGHCNICNVAYIFSTVILICSTARLRLCRLGTCHFLW